MQLLMLFVISVFFLLSNLFLIQGAARDFCMQYYACHFGVVACDSVVIGSLENRISHMPRP